MRRSLMSAVRAYDLVLLGASTMAVLALAGSPCSTSALLPLATFAGCFVLLNLLKPEFGYGTRADLLGVAISAVLAGAAFLAADAASCPSTARFGWAWLALLLFAPRAVASILRRRSSVSISHEDASIRPAAEGRHARTAWIVTLSTPVDEPRVRRQADALHLGGWNVVVFGYAGTAQKPAYWTLVELARPSPVPDSAIAQLLSPWWRRITLLGARFSERMADACYWMQPAHAQALQRIQRAASQHRLECHLVCHHDYFTAPIADRLARSLGVGFTSDIHEYARGQFMDRPVFRTLTTHYVHRLQRRYYPRAELLTVVCDGIAQLLAREYRLKRPPLTIRNVSFYEPSPFRPAGATVRVLYHGLLYHARGLEQAIDSVPRWRPDFTLVLRGFGPADYIAGLRRRAELAGVAGRVQFEPPVPVTELVGAANLCDIGLFASPSYSPQKYFTAPNKLFEYVMAGLAVCVSDLPEMRAVVDRYGVGRMFSGTHPDAIAEAINGFTREAIDACKQASLEAAKTLCWEQERSALIGAYEQIHRAARPVGVEPVPTHQVATR